MRNHKGIVKEVTPIRESDLIYIAERKEKILDYPLHTHDVFELNFYEHAQGAKRIVGDSEEVIGEMDLVLVANPKLVHGWEKNNYKGEGGRQITIQFNLPFAEDRIFKTDPYRQIREMLAKARCGLVFSDAAVYKVYRHLDKICDITEGFYAINALMLILYELAKMGEYRELASVEYKNVALSDDEKKMEEIVEFIEKNYRDEISLPETAKLFGMSVSNFGRFFKQNTGKTLSEYVIDMRLGYAKKQLLESNESILDICAASGFNNMSHFNRLFKRDNGCAPSHFRDIYRSRKRYDEGTATKTF